MSDNREKRLPPAWVVLTLGEVRADRSRGIIPGKQPNDKFELYSVPSFDSGKPEIVQGQSIGSNKQTVETDTVLLCKINPRINRVWVVENCSPHPKIASTEWIPFFRSKEFLPKYLCYYMRRGEFRDHLASQASGVGGSLMRIKASNLAGYPLPIAPFPEQLRIVAKIEELFSELDKGVESLKTARAKLKVYRQAVLKHAFEGKLTAQWREENKDKLETPEQLLARIKQERATRYEGQLKEWKAAVNVWEAEGEEGKKSPKPRKPKSPEFVVANPTCNPFWTQSLLDELAAESVLGKMLDREKNSGIARQYLGNLNLRWGKFDLKNLKTMKVEDSEIQRYSLARGDLVICEGGEPGRCAVWEGTDHTMIIQKALHRVRFTESYSPYFAYYFMTYAASSGLLSPNFTGSTIKHLTGKGLRNVLFPLCTLAEQNQTVHLLDRIFNLCDELDSQIEREIRRSDSLRQSILKKAFAGQLVAQDPCDEPASVLLDRIRAEREQAAKNNHSKKTKKKKPIA